MLDMHRVDVGEVRLVRCSIETERSFIFPHQILAVGFPHRDYSTPRRRIQIPKSAKCRTYTKVQSEVVKVVITVCKNRNNGCCELDSEGNKSRDIAFLRRFEFFCYIYLIV